MSMGILQTSATPVMSVRKLDRKSTRLNSSHTVISYAVFCLKKEQHTFELQPHIDIVYRLQVVKKHVAYRRDALACYLAHRPSHQNRRGRDRAFRGAD